MHPNTHNVLADKSIYWTSTFSLMTIDVLAVVVEEGKDLVLEEIVQINVAAEPGMPVKDLKGAIVETNR